MPRPVPPVLSLRPVHLLACATLLGAMACGDPDAAVEDDTDAVLGLPNTFVPVDAPEARYGSLAGELSWTTLDGGTFQLSDHVNGEDAVVVLLYVPGSGYHDAVWDGKLQKMLNDTPDGTHYVFGSHEATPADRRARLEALQTDFNQALNRMDDDRAALWREHLHYVMPVPTSEAFGWAKDLGASNIRRTDAYHAGTRNVGFAIDSQQRIRPMGEFVDWAAGGGAFPFEYLAHQAQFYAFERDRQAVLDAEDALEVTIWEDTRSGTGWGGEAIYTDVELPDVSAYDTLELDLVQACTHIEEITDKDGDGRDDNNGAMVGDLNCPEWDRITSVWLCDPLPPGAEAGGEEESCEVELGRWITAYTGGGRWVHDVTPLLSKLSEGPQRFRYKAIDNHQITLKLRLTQRGGPRVVDAIPLYTGGQLTACTNDRYQPMDVEIPATASKVEIATVISGHSFNMSSDNCGEFCNHEHHFTVNAQTFTEDHPEADDPYACLNAIDQGVVPNQYGSWIFGRAGWCPGLEVPMWRQDVTAAVTPGSTATLDYEVTVDGRDYDPTWFSPWDCDSGESAGFWVPEFSMQSWLVIYEDSP